MANVKSAIAVSIFLPYTMSWIYRQISDPIIGTHLVITQERENSDLFPFTNIHKLHNEPYWWKAVKAKMWFWFGNQAIRLGSSDIRKIKRELQKNSIQLVHAHFGTFGIYLIDICESLNVPLIVTFHGFDINSAMNRWPAYRKSFVRFLARIKMALVISEDMKQRLIEIGCPQEKIRVSYLGVPTEEFQFTDRSSNSGTVRFLHAGRLTAKKGVPELVRAFVNAFPENGVAELWIAGDGEQSELVKQTIQEFDATQRIKMLGKISPIQMADLMYQSDVFVLNSRVDSQGTKEGLPITILEASATGMPVISTYHAGIPEAVINEQTGLLVEEGHHEELTRALQKMMDKNYRLRLGKSAAEFVREKFELKKCNLRLSEIYKEAIA